MSQNNVKLGAVKNSAFLANVSYDSTDKMKTRDFAKVENDKITLTNPATGDKYEVINQDGSYITGFDATVFRKSGTNEYVISYTGTDSVLDVINDIDMPTLAINLQAVSAYNFTKETIEKILKENPNATFSVAGHSLGGTLAQQMAYTFDKIKSAITINAYGGEEIIKNQANYDEKKYKANESKVTNVIDNEDFISIFAKQYGNTFILQKDERYKDDHHAISQMLNRINELKKSGELVAISGPEATRQKMILDILLNAKNLDYDKLKDILEANNEKLEKMHTEVVNISLYDPIALDLNNNGKIDTLSLENGVFFDHNGDEIAFKSSWISGGDGILARDINGDNEINSGAELFGNFTQLKNGELAKNGVEALKDLDSDDNGVFDESDKAFNEILVWQDINSNAKSESSELKTLKEHGIKSINLKFSTDNTALDKDNKQILVGSFAINDRDEALASDIDFSVNTVEREMAESAGLIKGTGFIRDLADALVLSANSDNALVDIYNEFASLDEKQKQLKILPKLVNEWAKTSKHYKSINDDESFLQQNKINIVNIRSDVSTSYVNSLKSNDKVAINQELENTNNANIQSLTPSGLNKLLNQRNIDQDLLKQVLELKDKYSVLQAFSGKDIQTLYYDSNEDLLNIKANITKSYQAILDYTYKSSLMQTRLKEYANDLKLLVDTNMQDDSLKTLIDYSDALNKLENKAKDNLKEAFIDLIEFSDVFDDLSSLKQANDLVSKLINQAIDNNEIYYVLDLLDNNDILVNNLKDVLITKTINNENIYDLDAITSKLNVNIITNKDENNKLQGSNKDDIIISSKTNEDLVGNGGNDVYVFSKDWGKDIVYSYHNNKQSISLRFNDIKLNEIELSTNKNNDLIITDIANSNNEIFIQNALYDGEYKIDKIMLEDISLEFEEIKLLAYNKIEQGV